MKDEILQFDQTLKRIEFLSRYSGVNIKCGKYSTSDIIKYHIIYLINFFWLSGDLSGGIYWFIDGIRTGKDFLELTYIAPCISCTTLANIKGFFLILNKKHALRLIENLRNLEKKENGRQQTREKDEIVNKERKFLHIFINLINYLFVSLIVMFTVSPLVVITLKYYNTGELDLILPFMILYPFDPFQPKVWPFVYLHQFWSECIVYLYLCFSDLFFLTCCTYIRIQFKLLKHNIENLIPVQKHKFLDDDEFKNKFRELITWHQKLIETTTILEVIYSKSTLLNFLSSSLTICLTGFNVTMIQDVTFIITFVCFLIMSLFQVFFLCFFADLLSAASTEITDAVYKSRWYVAEPSVCKKLLIIQIRAQVPCKLTAFGFADVNLNSFMRVLSTSWSYFALLQTIYGD